MVPRLLHTSLLALLAGLALTAGCGTAPVTCGPGTRLVGGKCVASSDALSCGDGTSLADGQCVAGSDATSVDVAAADAVGADAPGDLGGSDAGCVPFCIGRVCGGDGCGGSCGACLNAAAPVCNELTGQCGATCVPQCTGKACGPDGCGGTCGTCPTGGACTAAAVCLPDSWTCTEAWFGDGAVCDCGCGAPDSDCVGGKLPVAGCENLQLCSTQGQCVGKVPSGWMCAPGSYAALDACNCGCGVPDPDCKYTSLPVVGCPGLDPVCSVDATCAACAPNCTGKQCGGDGCGGSCGACTGSTTAVCALGQCVEPCSPKPLKCQTATCGDDGCGGSCGTCAQGSTCTFGECVKPAGADDPTSCTGHCGSTAPAGCYCTPSCKATGFCCPDFAATCECKPNCADKTCGSDGCGGSCGTCGSDKPYCNASFQCDATCKPACAGKSCGPDGCGGTCGACGSGSTCSKASKCVPETWTCDALLYGDKLGCDCGCGAQDSDCLVTDAPVFGCPASTKSCTGKGVCDMTFCANNAACGNKWCVGSYAKGDGTWGGTCDMPVSGASAPGTGCQIDAECASLACIADKCRLYCSADGDCAATELCVGLPVAGQGLGALGGFAAVCNLVPGSHKPCKAQADCQPSGETCIALTDAKTLAPRLVCAQVGKASAIGASCAAYACAPGQLCVPTVKDFTCTIPCPAGVADCPSDWTCGEATFNGAGTATPTDDPKVPVCLPK